MNAERRRIIEKNEISEVKIFRLGGFDQKVLIEGQKATNPVLITLHGGPGMPVPFSVGCRGMFEMFTDRFILVCWDQLGCGANNHEIDNSFTVDKFVDMTVDLIKEIKKMFPDNSVYLMGMSWGSVLSARAAQRVPQLLDGVIVYGQILKNLFFNDEVYAAFEKIKLPKKVTKKLKIFREKTEYDTDDIRKIAGFIRKYTEGYQSKTGEKSPIGSTIIGLITSPDYTFSDFMAIAKNGFAKNTSIWDELICIDLSECLKNVTVKYRILQGDKDIVTCTKMISDFVSDTSNPNLTVKVIEDNAHMPCKSGFDSCFEECVNLIG